MKSLLFFFSEMKSSLFFFLNEFIIFLLVFARKAMNTSGEMKSFPFHEHPVTELARRQPPHQQSITRQHGTRRQPSSYRTRSDGTHTVRRHAPIHVRRHGSALLRRPFRLCG
jgi:hypothetical protein